MRPKELYEGAKSFWGRYRGEKKSTLGLAIIVFFILVAIFEPWISPHDPRVMASDPLLPPRWENLFGTDQLGRDNLSMIISGVKIALMFGLGAAGLSCLIGIFLGAIPGYCGGIVDDIFSRFFEIFLMIPRLFLLMLVALIYGRAYPITLLFVGLFLWPSNAKIMRAQVYSLKERGFVKAAIGSGGSSFTVLFRHIVPNGVYPVIANTTMQMATAILMEASLSYLGLGDLNVFSWGKLIGDGQHYLQQAWWIAMWPGLCLLLLCFAFNTCGDRLNFALNPRLRERL